MSTPQINFETIKKNVTRALKETAEWAAWEIEDAYETAIQNFYDDYEPSWYQRTGMSFYGSSGFKKPISSLVAELGEASFESGISVSEVYIPGNPYWHYVGKKKTPQDKEFIFENTFIRGLHGYNKLSKVNAVNRKRGIKVNYNKWKRKMTAMISGRIRGNPPKAQVEKQYKSIIKQAKGKLETALSGISLF